MTKKNILFICSENTCRSAYAEAIAKQMVGKTMNVYSAGINVKTELEPMNKYAEIILCNYIGCNHFHKSKKLTKELVMKCDYIFVMENKIMKKLPNYVKERSSLLCKDKDIIDPYNQKGDKLIIYQKMANQIIDCLNKQFINNNIKNNT